jgi:hypothetical protein
MTPIPSAADIDVDTTVAKPEGLADCRAVLARWATLHHFVPAAVGQVVSAANEVVVEGLTHGRPPVRIRAWSHGGTLVVHVEDDGGRVIAPDAGYRPPVGPTDPPGMWIARQLADALITHTGNGRTAVRMYFPYAVIHRNLRIPT